MSDKEVENSAGKETEVKNKQKLLQMDEIMDKAVTGSLDFPFLIQFLFFCPPTDISYPPTNRITTRSESKMTLY